MKIFFSGLKWYYTFEKNINIRFYQFFGYENGFWYYLRVRARKS